MRLVISGGVALAVLILTGCTPVVEPSLDEPSLAATPLFLRDGALAASANTPSVEALLGDWSGEIEWKPRRRAAPEAPALAPTRAQLITDNLWGMQIAITKQRTLRGETQLEGRATIRTGGLDPLFFSGLVIIKIIQKLVIVRIILDDGTILIIRQCKIILVFKVRSFSFSSLVGPARLSNCTGLFPGLVPRGNSQLDRLHTQRLDEMK
jgi:hypothetical protein